METGIYKRKPQIWQLNVKNGRYVLKHVYIVAKVIFVMEKMNGILTSRAHCAQF